MMNKDAKAKKPWVAATLVAGALAMPAIADGAKTVTFHNETNSSIVQFQLRPTGTKVWSADSIKQVPLGVQKSRAIALANGAACKYDFFITFDDGRQTIQQGADVCAKGPVALKDAPD